MGKGGFGGGCCCLMGEEVVKILTRGGNLGFVLWLGGWRAKA